MRRGFTLVAILAMALALTPSGPAAAAASVRVNEVSCSGVDWVELHNPTSVSVDISNWVLSDRFDGGTARHRFAIPRGTTLAAGAYVVFEQGSLSNQLPWGVDCSAGEEIFLFSAMAPQPVKVDSLQVPAAVAGFTYGRLSSTSAGHTVPTRGARNQDGRPALLSPASLKCVAGKACRHVLKSSNQGTIALTKPVAGVKVTKGLLTITARKKQKLVLSVRLRNAAGARAVTLTVTFA